MKTTNFWSHYTESLFYDELLGIFVDFSKVDFDKNKLLTDPRLKSALKEVAETEKGAIVNKDEGRMVGHYWLRTPELAPTKEIRNAIEETTTSVETFAKKVVSGEIYPEASAKKRFESALIVGIGGSALGPQFVSRALRSPNSKLNLYFFDNTDPAGMEDVLNRIPDLKSTLVVIISKSGGTKETRNGMLVAKTALKNAGVANPSKNFVAVTSEGSELDKVATGEGWLTRFPMWDWIGGRTSELSAVGLLPAALEGIDIREMLVGASQMDALTRREDGAKNPAALIALAWLELTKGRGEKDMVVLPYSDKLELISRYLQQLVMESLGKELDRDGKAVYQGIAVYGNKGSTDQHAYVQQLRDGVRNFFAVFVEVLSHDLPKTSPATIKVEDGITCGDYLSGFLYGTRSALFEKERQSITITVPKVSPKIVGALIAMFERAVGIYASLVNVNAYHQPGVEAGKKAATAILELQKKIVSFFGAKSGGEYLDSKVIAEGVGLKENDAERVFAICRHLAANGALSMKKTGEVGFGFKSA